MLVAKCYRETALDQGLVFSSEQDQKIAAFGSSYSGTHFKM
jgi:hypothetical protein